jgi:hypothetical protein
MTETAANQAAPNSNNGNRWQLSTTPERSAASGSAKDGRSNTGTGRRARSLTRADEHHELAVLDVDLDVLLYTVATGAASLSS